MRAKNTLEIIFLVFVIVTCPYPPKHMFTLSTKLRCISLQTLIFLSLTKFLKNWTYPLAIGFIFAKFCMFSLYYPCPFSQVEN